MTVDPTRIDIDTDPLTRRMKGVAYHGDTPFDVPYMTEIDARLWQGGCETGMILPANITHVVSLYPWERYEIQHTVDSELYVQMYDSEAQGFEQVDMLAAWINACRAAVFEPINSMALTGGPMNTTPASPQALAKSGFSARNP